MTQNVVETGAQVLSVVLSAAVLLLFALAIALPHRPKVRPASSGHRDSEEETTHEEIRPDGYIDSFAGQIEEAGGGLPPLIKLALPGVILWWLVYLILNWTQR